MKHALAYSALLVTFATGAALASPTQPPTPGGGPTSTGQPNQTCGTPSAPNTPGNSVNVSGSVFNPNGVSGMVYAGQQTQNTINIATASQYDVACSHTQSAK
jgi:hypothetical protein